MVNNALLMLKSSIDLCSLRELLQSGDLTPSEVTTYYLGRISQYDASLNVFCYLDEEALLADAKELDQQSGDRRGRLWGVPIPIKVLTPVKGWPLTGASRHFERRVASFSHEVVQRLQHEGALLLGQTTSPEFGSLPVTESSLYGVTKNPWNVDHTPGGSSGGAAAAVSAGLAVAAHASDGGGSIRIPASCCGLVGLKPSRGVMPCGPMMTLSLLSTNGFVTRTVADTALLLDCVSGPEQSGWMPVSKPSESYLSSAAPSSSKKFRVGFTVDSPFAGAVDPACKLAVEQTANACRELGHEVSEAVPDWGSADEFAENFLKIWVQGVSDPGIKDISLLEPENAHLHERGRQNDSMAFIRAQFYMQALSRRMTAAWGRDFDILLTPTLGTEPMRVGVLKSIIDADPEAGIRKAFDFLPFTAWFNVTGQPAVSLPVGFGESGIPVGVQAIAAPWEDAQLLQFSAQLETYFNWQDRVPKGFRD